MSTTTDATLRKLLAAGRVALELGDHDDALEAATSALENDPASTDAHALKLRALLSLRRIRDARAAALDWARRLPRDDRAGHLAIGDLAVELKEPSVAVDAYRRALAIDPANGETLYKLGRALERDHREEDGALAIDLARTFDARLAMRLDTEANAHRQAYDAAAIANGAKESELSGGGNSIAGYAAVLLGGVGFLSRAMRVTGRRGEGGGLMLAAFALLIAGGVAYLVIVPIVRRRRAERRLLQLDAQLVAILTSVRAGRRPTPDAADLDARLA